jgi:hypothetical protein
MFTAAECEKKAASKLTQAERDIGPCKKILSAALAATLMRNISQGLGCQANRMRQSDSATRAAHVAELSRHLAYP